MSPKRAILIGVVCALVWAAILTAFTVCTDEAYRVARQHAARAVLRVLFD